MEGWLPSPVGSRWLSQTVHNPALALLAILVVGLGWLVHPEPATGTVATGAIGDTVWLDADGDGLQDADEPGIEGVSVRLIDGDGDLLQSTATNGAGRYAFEGLGAGAYVVAFVAPAGFAFTLQKVGTNPSIDSDPDPTTGRTDVIALDAGEIDWTIDAGLVPSGSTTTTVATTTTTTTSPPSTSVPSTSTSTVVSPTSTSGSSSSTTSPSASSTTSSDVGTTTTAPPTSSTSLSRREQLERLAGSLTRGTMTVDERRCGGVEVRNTVGTVRVEVQCVELVADEEFFFVFSIRRTPDDSSTTSSSSTPVTNTSTPVPIETAFRMRALLSFDPDQALVRPQGRPVESDGEAEITREVLEGGEVSFPFAVRPTRAGEIDGRLLLLALDEEDDSITAELAAGAVTLQVDPPPAPSSTAVSTVGSTLTSVEDAEAEMGGVPLWTGAVGGLALLGAIAWFSRSRATSSLRSRLRRTTVGTAAGAGALAAPLGSDSRRVFISYSRKDAAKVDRLQEDLEAAGYDTWVDRGDITGGEVWKAEIVRGIRASDVVVLVLSPNSVDSAHVAVELSLGRSHAKPIIPVRLTPDAQLSDRLAYDLADLQFIDLFGDRAAGIGNLLMSLRGLFEQPDADGSGDASE